MQEKKYIHTTNVHNKQAAQEVVPVILKLFNPSSVADIGCGLGTWLHVFQEMGVKEIMGFDGSYVDFRKLNIDPRYFQAVDLEKPLPETRKYDLVLCLEVAEHLQSSAAETLVQSLVRLSDIIVFSAAVPGQGGQNHINEQWPSWWALLFEKHGYRFFDIFRPEIWDNPKIDWWYRQNIFLVTKPSIAAVHGFSNSYRSYIHPELFSNKMRKINDYETGEVSLMTAWNVFKKSFGRAIRKRLGG